MQLTDEDRAWFTTLITTLIRQSEERTDRRMESRFEASELKTKEAIEASENRLLIAFQKWASPLEMKVRAHGMAIGAFDGEKENSIEQAARLADLERRVSRLEKAS